ncbi:hypothetical protein H1P_3640005 [Hyella patelloides LEGE 07179]|uniref:GmrSD restriction endonucleases N-terminal domain-containing protein n=2 Tax=Hyella TaxID=945733 RepID=A0A563VWA9_9CYAN|nr:hypothetical protein H1P_3640005 [Hyella patelloides LEGE 07179]
MYEIIDGMQRLNAIFGFIENHFSVNNKFFDVTKSPLAHELSKQNIFESVDKETAKLLNASECLDFLSYSLAVTTYRANSQEEIEDVFNRINSNGKHLSPQEVRQAGVTSSFSGLVRSLASEIRGDVSQEILPLTKMPEISIDAKSISLGYGVIAEDTFWCNQGIINTSNLRDSEDEQILADIILSIALNNPFPASKDKFDSFGIVGLEREAKIHNTSLDDYILFISRKIRSSQLPEWLKTQVNTNLIPINYKDCTVLMIKVEAGNEPAWYKNKLYIRDGHEKQA